MSDQKTRPKRKSDDEQYSDEEAERRATDALRRTLMTPYKPQKDMVGKVGRGRLSNGKENPKG
jgi:hypothetical protein